ncbi:MAG TPA: permease-like cell division protein FtsX [Ferruginibacter sp.]|nr:permease-like cell division protein FtsX [Ferruginibacter sp.]
MAQFGKASSKKSKPTYGYAIVGVALVLFLFGIVGWFFLNLRKTGDYLKENIQVHTYLNRDAPKKRIDSLVNYISSIPYANRVEYVTKEKAIEKWNSENDTTWKQFLSNNPLPESIDFYVKANYVDSDSLNILSANLQNTFPGVISEFQFPTETVSKVSSYVKTAGFIFLIAAILLTVLVVFSIDNTIRLAMYSNRFLIKTMQMVGATRWFIAKPINQRAILNGLIASGIAIAAIWGTVLLIESFLPDFKLLHDNKGLIMLFIIIIILGITISLASTHRSVIKYLRMKLDDLY